MISGAEPILGRQVYDINLGYGEIISVEPDMAFVVDFGSRRKQRYSTGGFIGNVRRVYWDNPIVVEPGPDEVNWLAFVEITRKLYSMVRRLGGR